MKLNIQEVFFLKNAVENSTVKGADAPFVTEVLGKLVKEFTKLEQTQQQVAPELPAPVKTAKKSKE